VNPIGGLSASLRDFQRPRLWLGTWWFGWLLCIVLSLIHPPQIGVDLPDGDKLGHFLAYATLSAWSVLIFATRRNHWKAALSLVLLGIVMEFAQGVLTSDRMMDPRDALANTLGVLAGQLVALSRVQVWLQRWDARLFG
jgi:VanZ family protein